MYTVWASRRSYTYSEGPPELGAPENLTFRWNQAYLVQNCAKNAIQTRKFWEKCMTDCFFWVARTGRKLDFKSPCLLPAEKIWTLNLSARHCKSGDPVKTRLRKPVTAVDDGYRPVTQTRRRRPGNARGR